MSAIEKSLHGNFFNVVELSLHLFHFRVSSLKMIKQYSVLRILIIFWHAKCLFSIITSQHSYKKISIPKHYIINEEIRSLPSSGSSHLTLTRKT